MTTGSDYLDFTQPVSRLNQQAIESPISAHAVGWQAASVTVPQWANSLQIMVVLPTGVQQLQVIGATSGFTYLSAAPAFDGGLYYLPVMAGVDSHVNISWYQNTIAIVNIYVVTLDEPVSIATFNPISASGTFVESPDPTSPHTMPVNALTAVTINIDTTTRAVRCALSNPNNVTYGKVVGTQSGSIYYDGSGSNSSIPVSPIQVDSTIDVQVTISVQTNLGGSTQLYIASVDVPDYAGRNPISQGVTPNGLAVPITNSELPNQHPATFDAAIAASTTVTLVLGVAGVQYRLHQVLFMQSTAVLTNIDLLSSSGDIFCKYHNGAGFNSVFVPLLGQVIKSSTSINLRNNGGAASGAIAVTLWYSVL